MYYACLLAEYAVYAVYAEYSAFFEDDVSVCTAAFWGPNAREVQLVVEGRPALRGDCGV